jgi:hypothetical protein
LGGCFGPADESSGLGSAARFVASSSGAPPIAVSLAADVPSVSVAVSSASVDAVDYTIIGPRMPFTSW